MWHEFLWNSVYRYQLVLLNIPWHYICRFNTTVHPVTSWGCACAFKGELMLCWLWQWSEFEADFIATTPLVMELKNYNKNKNKIKNDTPVSFPFHLPQVDQRNWDVFCVQKQTTQKVPHPFEEKNRWCSVSVSGFSIRHCSKIWKKNINAHFRSDFLSI